MPPEVDADLRRRVEEHYRRCEEVLRAVDLDGFLDWLGPDGSFEAPDGTTVRIADTRPFWAWRFGNVLEVRRCDMHVESVGWSAPSVVEVDFREVTHAMVRGFAGEAVARDAVLRNRNWWRVEPERLTTVGGTELEGRRTLDGVELVDDEQDPWGMAAWRRHRESPDSAAPAGPNGPDGASHP